MGKILPHENSPLYGIASQKKCEIVCLKYHVYIKYTGENIVKLVSIISAFI